MGVESLVKGILVAIFGLGLMASVLVPFSDVMLGFFLQFTVRPVFGEGRISRFVENNPIVIKLGLFLLGLILVALSASSFLDLFEISHEQVLPFLQRP
jgi:hypothetical protein